MKTLALFQRRLSAAAFAAAAALFVPAGLTLVTPQAEAVAVLPDFTDLVDKVGPAVVNIRTTERVKQMQQGGAGSEEEEMQEFFRRFFGQPVPPRQQPGPRGRSAPQQQDEQQQVRRGVG